MNDYNGNDADLKAIDSLKATKDDDKKPAEAKKDEALKVEEKPDKIKETEEKTAKIKKAEEQSSEVKAPQDKRTEGKKTAVKPTGNGAKATAKGGAKQPVKRKTISRPISFPRKIATTAILYAMMTIIALLSLIPELIKVMSNDAIADGGAYYKLAVAVLTVLALILYIPSTSVAISGLMEACKLLDKGKGKGIKITFIVFIILPIFTEALFILSTLLV